MLPVSGALQLKASGPMGLRPMISQRGAYSRFVRPAPRSESGKKRFHNPLAFASSLSSSMTRGKDHLLPDASNCSWNFASFGYTSSSIKASIRARKSLVLSENSKITTSPLNRVSRKDLCRRGRLSHPGCHPDSCHYRRSGWPELDRLPWRRSLWLRPRSDLL